MPTQGTGTQERPNHFKGRNTTGMQLVYFNGTQEILVIRQFVKVTQCRTSRPIMRIIHRAYIDRGHIITLHLNEVMYIKNNLITLWINTKQESYVHRRK